MHTDAFHHSLALIDHLHLAPPPRTSTSHLHLALIVHRIAPHDAALAHSLRAAATAIPQHIAAGRLGRAHSGAVRVHVLLLVAQAWGYLRPAALAEAQHTARHLQALTATA
jgi:hypothetical protein